MAKTRTYFLCQNCGYESAKWLGRCPSCQSWNTFSEETKVVQSESKNKKSGLSEKGNPKLLLTIDSLNEERIDSHDNELNRVLGGGIVPGSVILVGGEPGIGKSTLLLQTAMQLAPLKVLYVSGEESERQIRMRADRLGKISQTCYVVNETSLEAVLFMVEQTNPELLIIDSIQTLKTDLAGTSAGSLVQIRECTNQLQQLAKQKNLPIFLVGHITKEGTFAGPKILEHTVDTVLYFEGERHYGYRILRTIKNRFGSAQEIGIYQMDHDGLHPVPNPSEFLITRHETEISGITITATMEGLRPLMIEIQSLVSTATYGVPQRSCTGYDVRRLNMLLAVLEKRVGLRLAQKDVFLNITGGIKLTDPSADLAVTMAIMSSAEDVAVPFQYVFAAEVGLSGEVRPVSYIEQRIAEADKLGYKKIFISGFQSRIPGSAKHKIQIIPVSQLEQLVKQLFT